MTDSFFLSFSYIQLSSLRHKCTQPSPTSRKRPNSVPTPIHSFKWILSVQAGLIMTLDHDKLSLLVHD